MKTTITATELKNILDQHRLWIESSCKLGTRADLTDADLTDADLTEADLKYANLMNATLTNANLTGAYLKYATLTGANLTNANLTNATLTEANLTKANLTGTILEGKNTKKQTETSPASVKGNIREEIEAIAKKHGMKIESIMLSFL